MSEPDSKRTTKTAYVVTASFPAYGDAYLRMLVFHHGTKRDVEAIAVRDGWKVKRVSVASWEDFNEVTKYDELLVQVKQEVDAKRQRDLEDAEARRQYEILQREIARHNLEKSQREEHDREKKREEAHDLALSRAAGDIFGVDLEPDLMGDAKVAALCAKSLLFFDQTRCASKEMFTAVSIDYADFQSRSTCSHALGMIRGLVDAMNVYLEIENDIADYKGQLGAFLSSCEEQVNSIDSRTRYFGGSGDGLWISMILANAAAGKDRRAIELIQSEFLQEEKRTNEAIQAARLRQQLIEYRAKAAASMLLTACGRSDGVQITMSEQLEQYVLRTQVKDA